MNSRFRLFVALAFLALPAFAMQFSAKRIIPIKYRFFSSQKEIYEHKIRELRKDYKNAMLRLTEESGFYIPDGSKELELKCPSSIWDLKGEDKEELNTREALHEFLNYLTLFPVPEKFPDSDLNNTMLVYTKESYPGHFTNIQQIINNNKFSLYIKLDNDFYPIPAHVINGPVEINLEAFFVQTNAESKLKNSFFRKQNTKEWLYLNKYLGLFSQKDRKVISDNFAKILKTYERKFEHERKKQEDDHWAGGMASRGPYEGYAIYRPWPLIINLDQEKFEEHLKEKYNNKLVTASDYYFRKMADIESQITKLKNSIIYEKEYLKKNIEGLKKAHENEIDTLKRIIKEKGIIE